MSYSIVSVLNYQDLESLEKLLFKSTKSLGVKKILVDDNSGIEGAEELAKEYGWEYIRNDSHKGRSASSNIGIKATTNENIILADPDTYMPKGTTEFLVSELKNKKVGVVGPQLNDFDSWTAQYDREAPRLKDFKKNPDVFEDYANLVKWASSGESEETRVTGSVMAFTKTVYNKVGGFDEKFDDGFFEDTDFVSSVMAKGYKSIFKKDVFVHHGGYKGSSRTIFQKKAPSMIDSMRHNVPLYAEKHGYPLKHIVKGFSGSFINRISYSMDKIKGVIQ